MKGTGNLAGKALQIVAVCGMALIVTIILHKGFADISALWDEHSGKAFWRSLARYFISNLAG